MTQYGTSPSSNSLTGHYISGLQSEVPPQRGGEVWPNLHRPVLDDEGRYATFNEPPPPTPPPRYHSSPFRSTPRGGEAEEVGRQAFISSSALKAAADTGKLFQSTPTPVKGEERDVAEGSVKRIRIRDWYIAFQHTKAARRLNAKAEGLSHWVQVAGVLEEGCNEHEAGQAWHSSLIVERITPRLIKTKSGTLYELIGACDQANMQQKKGFSEELVRPFVQGFPADWCDLLVEEARRRGHVASPRKRHRGKANRAVEQRVEYRPNPVKISRRQVRPVTRCTSEERQQEEAEDSGDSGDEYIPNMRTGRTGDTRGTPSLQPSTSRSPSSPQRVKPILRKSLPREVLALSKTKWGRLMVVENAIMDGIEESRAERLAKKRHSLPAHLADQNPSTPQAQVGSRSSLTPRMSTRRRSAARNWWEVPQPAPPVFGEQRPVLAEGKSSKRLQNSKPKALAEPKRPVRRAKELRVGQYLTSDLSGVFSDSADDYVARAQSSIPPPSTSSPLGSERRKRGGAVRTDRSPKRARLDDQMSSDVEGEVPEADPDEIAASSVGALTQEDDESETAEDVQVEHDSESDAVAMAMEEDPEVSDGDRGLDLESPHTAPSSPQSVSSDEDDEGEYEDADVETGITSVSDEDAQRDGEGTAVIASHGDTATASVLAMSKQVDQMRIQQPGPCGEKSVPTQHDIRQYLVLSSSTDDAASKGSADRLVEDVEGAVKGTREGVDVPVAASRIVYDLTLDGDDDASVYEEDEEEDDGNSLDSEEEEDPRMSDADHYCFSD